MGSSSKKEILYGNNTIKIALELNKRKGYKVSYISEKGHEEIIELALKKHIHTEKISKDEMQARIDINNHQGILYECSPLQFPALKDSSLLDQEDVQILILDQLQSPQNVGAIIRSAEFLGYHAIITLTDRACNLNAAVSKASAGAMEQALIYQETNLQQVIKRLKSKHFWIVGSDMGGTSLYQFDVPKKHALILGNENYGMRRLTKEACDFLVSIPGSKMDSLNVNAAAAIFMNFMKFKLS